MSRLSLRTLFSATTIVLALVALVSATSLMTLTTLMRRATSTVAAAVESVRLAEEAEIDLLLAERASDPLVRRDHASAVRRRVLELGAYVSTAEERAQYDAAVAATRTWADALLRERRSDGGAAYDSLEALVTVNVEQARAARAEAERWDAVADVVSLATAALVLLVTAFVIVFLRARAFRPAYELAAAMRRFGADPDVRASPSGGAELREIAERFNEMADALTARRRAQVAFLGGVAHDLRGPLTAIQLAVASAARKPLPDEERLRAVLERTQRSATLLERMVGDFLDIARIESGELSLRMHEDDVGAVAARVAALFEGRSPRHRLVVDAMPAPALCDAARLEQVLTNLLSNAIKYSPDGGDVALRVRNDVGADGARVVVEVTDAGIGISADDEKRLFEPFRRVGLSRESIPGVGLGLWVVRNIVQAHGGRIDVESALGRGTTFRVTLPGLAPAAQVPAPQRSATA